MIRPQTDDYYWYRPKDGDHNDWQPVQVTDDMVFFIGKSEPTNIDILYGDFVKMGRPIPVMNLKLT